MKEPQDQPPQDRSFTYQLAGIEIVATAEGIEVHVTDYKARPETISWTLLEALRARMASAEPEP